MVAFTATILARFRLTSHFPRAFSCILSMLNRITSEMLIVSTQVSVRGLDTVRKLLLTNEGWFFYNFHKRHLPIFCLGLFGREFLFFFSNKHMKSAVERR